jgi:hypothetical protein
MSEPIAPAEEPAPGINPVAELPATTPEADYNPDTEFAPQPEPTPEPENQPELTEEAPQPDAPTAPTAPPSLDLGRFTDEFTTQGSLSEESYTELAERHGLSRDVVDTYIEGVKTRTETFTKAVYDAAGGVEKFEVLGRWARDNLSQEELEPIGLALQSGKASHAALAVRGLMARYEAENGREPTLISGGAPEGRMGAFRSMSEVVAAMSDPRYAVDEDYRKEVEKRLSISNVI